MMAASRFPVFVLLGIVLSGSVALAAVPARADSLRNLSGTVSYRERMALPQGAVLNVRIEERGEGVGAPLVMAEQHRMVQGEAVQGGVPISYTLTYPALPPEGHYVLRADITVGGVVLFATPPAGEALDRPSLLLQRMATFADARAVAPASPDGHWLVERIDGRALPVAGREPSLVISSDGRVSGYDGCNRFMGRVAVSGASMRFSGFATTRMACLKPATMPGTLETILSSVTSWMRDAQGRLVLSGSAGSVMLSGA